MKRYFIAPSADMAGIAAGNPDPLSIGEYHYIDLGSHGAAGAGFVALVMMNERKAPPPNWQPLPSVMDAVTTIGSLPAVSIAAMGQTVQAPALPVTPLALLANVGAVATQGGYALAKQLATIHPIFAP